MIEQNTEQNTEQINVFEDFFDKCSRRPSVPVLLEGAAGAGKTSLVEQYAEARDIPMVKLLASTLDETDVAGIVVYDKEKHTATTVSPAWYHKLKPENGYGGRGILFLDELSCGRKEVVDTMLTLVCSRHLPNGDYLGEGVMIIAAQNPAKDYDNYELSPAMRNRFMHIKHELDIKQWCEWMVGDIPPMQKRPLDEYLTFKQWLAWFQEKPEHGADKKTMIREAVRLGLKFNDDDISDDRDKKRFVDLQTPTSARSLSHLLYWTDDPFDMLNWAEAFIDEKAALVLSSVDVDAYRNAGNAVFSGRAQKDVGQDELEKVKRQNQIQGKIKQAIAKL